MSGLIALGALSTGAGGCTKDCDGAVHPDRVSIHASVVTRLTSVCIDSKCIDVSPDAAPVDPNNPTKVTFSGLAPTVDDGTHQIVVHTVGGPPDGEVFAVVGAPVPSTGCRTASDFQVTLS